MSIKYVFKVTMSLIALITFLTAMIILSDPEESESNELPRIYGVELGPREAPLLVPDDDVFDLPHRPDLCYVIVETRSGIAMSFVSCWHLRQWDGSTTWTR